MVGTFSGRVDCLFVYSEALTSKGIIFLFGFFLIDAGSSIHLCGSGLHVVERRSKVDIDVSLDDADGVVLIFGLDLKNVDFKFIPKNLYSDGVLLVKTGEVSELVLKDCFRVV